MAEHPVIDLHMHSTVSDGTDTPAELLSRVREAGIERFSVTDHDAISACEQIARLLQPGDPKFLYGVEFSCKDALGKYHVLGYRYDPSAPSIRSLTAFAHENRMRKLDARLERLRGEFGLFFSERDVRALHALSNPGKPHLARLMVLYGYAESIGRAFSDVLNRLHVPGDYIRPEDAIAGILGAGGIPVLAHPCFGDGDQRIFGQELEDRVVRLIGFGIKGLEGFYSGFDRDRREQVLALAERHGLYVTAGSDYHGGNKQIRLAQTGLMLETPLPKGLERFLKDAF